MTFAKIQTTASAITGMGKFAIGSAHAARTRMIGQPNGGIRLPARKSRNDKNPSQIPPYTDAVLRTVALLGEPAIAELLPGVCATDTCTTSAPSSRKYSRNT
jgi:hypothetical protein